MSEELLEPREDLGEIDEPPSKYDHDPARKQPNPLHEVQAWSRYTHRILMRLVARMVPWTEFWEYQDEEGREKTLAYYRFEALLGLAMADCMTEYPDKKKSQILQATQAQIEKLRNHPQYEPVRTRVMETMRRLKKTRGIDGWAELLEDIASTETAAIGLFSSSTRDKQAAIDTFLDRRSAKKGRGGEAGQVHIHLPDSFVSTRDRALQIEAEMRSRIGEAEGPKQIEGDVIDATYVRVPDDED